MNQLKFTKKIGFKFDFTFHCETMEIKNETGLKKLEAKTKLIIIIYLPFQQALSHHSQRASVRNYDYRNE